ncbi:MAG: FAD-binding protein [Pirellulaceae bacterium]|nr:FAD-binding protein [Pirellulaceae bacterium]
MAFTENLRQTLRENESLVPYTWLQMGGPARYFAEPGSLGELAALIKQAHQARLPIRILGSGSNLLVREEGVEGLVIRLCTAEMCKVTIQQDRLVARSGAKLNHVIAAAVAAGLGGLEHLAGIPGTVGAALANNSGGSNADIGSRVACVTILDREGQLVERSSGMLQFGFRRSNLADSVIAEVQFKLRVGDSAELTRQMQSKWIVRRASQPVTGSRTVQAFIEPDGTKLADVLEQAGVRDAREGDFYMDPAHPGFVLASGQPKSKDLLALLTRVSRSVESRCGIQLQSQLKIW